MAMVNLDALHSFTVFAERLNFTHAAQDLHIAQPSLHVKIRKLAEALDVSLYRRQGRQLELTEDGKRVAAFGREIQQRSQSFLKDLAVGGGETPVVLAAGEGAYLYLLGPALRRFVRKDTAPLRLLTLDGSGAIEAVRSGKAHLGVASLEASPDGMETHLLARVEQVLVMAPSHPLAVRKILRLADLDGEALIVPPPGRPHRVLLSRVLQSAGVSWKVAVEASGWELMMEFARMGIGVAVVNAFCGPFRGLEARPIRGLPLIHYHLFHSRGIGLDGARGRLKTTLMGRD